MSEEQRARQARWKSNVYDDCYPNYVWSERQAGIESRIDSIDANRKITTTNQIDIEVRPQKRSPDLLKVTLRDGASRYYDDYYESVDRLAERWPGRVLVVDTYAALEDAETMKRIYDFLALEFDDMITIFTYDVVVIWVFSVIGIVVFVILAKVHLMHQIAFSQQWEGSVNSCS